MNAASEPSTIHQLLIRQADRFGSAPVLVVHDRRALTYAMLLAEVERTLSALAAAGLGRGSRIALTLPNGPEGAVLMLSALSGATCVPLNPVLGSATYGAVFRDLRVDALIAAEGTDTPAVTSARSQGIRVVRYAPRVSEAAGVSDLRIETATPAVPRAAALPDDIAVIYQTSGTTSKPKAVPLTQAQVVSRARTQPIDGSDRCLFVAPIFTAGALAHTLLAPIAAGASLAFARGRGEDALIDALQDLGPTYFSANPTILISLLERIAQRSPTQKTALRFVRSSASSLAAELQQSLEDAFGVPVIQGYGITECGTAAQNPMPPARRKFGSVGISVGPEIAIVDPQGARVDPGVAGEIIVRSPGVMSGYDNDPEASRKSLRDGWYHTGDLGYLDDDDYLFVVGRINDIVNRGGMKVSPSEVDEALMRHPDVVDAAAFGVAHPSLGQDLVAAVALRVQSRLSVQQLREFAFEHLPSYKVPSTIVFVDTVPRNATKKVNRTALAGDLKDLLRADFATPRNEHEAQVIAIFSEVLGVDRVGADDNFFGLGGDSLRGTQVIARANAAFGTSLGVDTLFRSPTVAAFAALISTSARPGIDPREIAPERAGIPRVTPQERSGN